MLADDLYELCLPVLEDEQADDDDKTDRLQELLAKQAALKGKALENAILDALWRYRHASKGDDTADTPLRSTVIRKASPAPWQMNRAPTPVSSPPQASSPAPSSNLSAARPSFSRQRSNAQSPFASPRPSPRLALAQPIPHSPNLNAYEFSDQSAPPDIGDYGSENVDWLLGEETASNASSTGLSAVAPEWVPQPDMSPYDILRSVLGDAKTDEEIEQALNQNSYELGATIAALVGSEAEAQQYTVPDTKVLVGKSMAMSPPPSTAATSKSPIVCKYWLASGSCLRADCRFAHDTSAYLCKYWVNGQCLAGEACQFSHDPSLVINHLSVDHTAAPPAFHLSDQNEHFPALGSTLKSSGLSPAANGFVPAAQRARAGLSMGPSSRPHSRQGSRPQNRPETPSSLSMDDPESFPSLASLAAKRGSKHHGHRSRHGHTSIEKEPSSLADIVRMSPSPAPTQPRKPEIGRKIRPYGGSDTVAARKIPEPQHIPWLETGAKANQQYLKFRAEAIKHGSIRNKFLQSAAQAWNRNDARAAKALSLRGQAENEAMRKAHREAAKALYDERNKHLSTSPTDDEELYVDLHGLHPEEAIDYLEEILLDHEKRGRHIIYAITGTGHHSKNGKDKVGKGVRNWLNEWGYTFREFSVPGERGGYIGGVLGIDITAHRRQPIGEPDTKQDDGPAVPITAIGGKIQVLKREEAPC
ncbi:hypothetical protein DV735_g2643, partial [Chaetothyriales sp. CBS 134920]